MKIYSSGYKNFNTKWGRIQLYYPQFFIKNGDIHLNMDINIRICWKKYRAFAFAFIFGIGFDLNEKAVE